jgi:hypothetical protein
MPRIRRSPGTARATSTTPLATTHYIAGLHRRRAATYRVPPLDCNCRDPWTCRCRSDAQPSERMVDAYRDAALTISAVGLTPALFVPEGRALWRRGRADRDLVRAISSRWEAA